MVFQLWNAPTWKAGEHKCLRHRASPAPAYPNTCHEDLSVSDLWWEQRGKRNPGGEGEKDVRRGGKRWGRQGAGNRKKSTGSRVSPDASLGPESAPSHLVVHEQNYMWRASETVSGHVPMPLHKGRPSPSTMAPGSSSLCPGSGQQEGTEFPGSHPDAHFWNSMSWLFALRGCSWATGVYFGGCL